jgi:predicted Zn-dependent peptidase
MTSIAKMLEKTELVDAVPPAVPISHGLAFPSKQVVRDYPLVKTRTKKGLANTSFMIGFPCCNQYDDDKYHCIMLTDLLNGLSGRLALLLREKHGLAYKCKASCERSLKTKGVSEKELTYSKERIRGKTLATFEDIATFAEYNGYHELVLSHEKKFVPIDKVHERHFDTITVKQMHKLIQTLFVPERLMVAVVSNHPPTVKEIETERAKFR